MLLARAKRRLGIAERLAVVIGSGQDLHSGSPVPSRLQVAEATPEPKVAANRRREEFRYERWGSEIIHVKPLDCKWIAV
jgi:hypothetical protein